MVPIGLDNIPYRYPCRTAGTAVTTAGNDDDEGRIDCRATQTAGGCPWQNDYNRDRPGMAVYGMVGTDCWYRGGAGNWMLERLERDYDPPGSFYGDQCDEGPGPDGTPAFCQELGTWMEDHAKAYARLVRDELTAAAEEAEGLAAPPLEEQLKDELEQYRYAVWWLKWAAARCDGFHAWY